MNKKLIGWMFVLVSVCAFLIVLHHSAESARGDYRKIRCAINLRLLGQALAQYVQDAGGGTYYPYPGNGDFGGAQFLAAVYWAGVIAEPKVFICPSTSDSNDDGFKLGSSFRKVAPDAVSYASRGSHLTAQPMTASFPSDTVLAADDDEGAPNHRDRTYILYSDLHVKLDGHLVPRSKAWNSTVKDIIGVQPPLDTLEN